MESVVGFVGMRANAFAASFLMPAEGVTEDERSSLAAQDGAGLAKSLRGFPGLPEPVASDGEMRIHARFVAMAIEAFTRSKIPQRKLDELGSRVQVSDLSRRLRGAGLGWGVGLADAFDENVIGRAGTATPGELAVLAVDGSGRGRVSGCRRILRLDAGVR